MVCRHPLSSIQHPLEDSGIYCLQYIESYDFPIHSDQLTKAMSLNAGILCMKKADFFSGEGRTKGEEVEDEKYTNHQGVRR